MNYISKISFAGLLLASSSLFAVEPAIGWYGGLFVGPSLTPSRDVTVIIPSPYTSIVTPSLSYGLLVNGGGQLGYRCNKFRFEGELLYNINNINKITEEAIIGPYTISTSENLSGETWLIGGLFNVYYEFYDIDNSATRWVPYLGLGVGYAQINSSLNYTLNGIHANYRISQISNEPIAQGILGINYFLSDMTSLGTDFRYYTTSITNNDSNGSNNFNSRYSAYSMNLVFNYTFDQTSY